MGISPKDFEKMQGRLAGKVGVKRAPTSVHPATSPEVASRHAVIIGIDPSLRGTGYGVIRLAKPHPIALTHGAIKCPAGWERSRCLLRIVETLRDKIRETSPSACAIEGLFYAQNPQTTLIMGEARGASLVAAAEGGLDIFEIAPRKVKQAIVGYGAAQKMAVARMVQRLLHLAQPPEPDAADALALALAFAQEVSRFGISGPKKI